MMNYTIAIIALVAFDSSGMQIPLFEIVFGITTVSTQNLPQVMRYLY